MISSLCCLPWLPLPLFFLPLPSSAFIFLPSSSVCSRPPPFAHISSLGYAHLFLSTVKFSVPFRVFKTSALGALLGAGRHNAPCSLFPVSCSSSQGCLQLDEHATEIWQRNAEEARGMNTKAFHSHLHSRSPFPFVREVSFNFLLLLPKLGQPDLSDVLPKQRIRISNLPCLPAMQFKAEST